MFQPKPKSLAWGSDHEDIAFTQFIETHKIIMKKAGEFLIV